jgi:catechol 2,3-dioxygenase-like lactoylglutathione lyase family enzyme
MKLDHIAYRVKDRHKAAGFFQSMFGYEIGTEFDVEFDDGSKAECYVLLSPMNPAILVREGPEIFISDGSPGSIVGDWVKARGDVGGIHHIAYRVKDIDNVVGEWKKQDTVDFLTDNIIDCPDDDLRQIFTKPLDYLGGIIIELIERGAKGFCQNSVKNLMEATKELK